MNRKIAIGVLFLFVQAIVAQKSPNIILIMTDDQGWEDAGFNGSNIVKTPNLDALAKQGMVLERFYAAAPVCSPTRASVVTGRSPFRIGIPTANSGHLRAQEITIAELLKQKGYSTGHFGKWHLGTLTKKEKDANRGGKKKFENDFTIPTAHGYDSFFCTESKVPTYDPLLKPVTFEKGESLKYGWTAIEKNEATKKFGTSYWVGKEEKSEGDLRGDDTRIIMDKALSFVEASTKKKQPFFTTIWTHAPHLPVVTSKYYKDKYKHLSEKEQLYYGCITALDDQIGRLWKKLESLGVAENTLIWFCSDNGPENKTPGSPGVFRGRKRSLYEGGLRTPAFVVWKDKIKGNQRATFPAFTSDYLPTIVSVLGIEFPSKRPLDGIDLMPFIKQPNQKRKKGMGFRFRNRISWVKHQYKLISEDSGKTYELYDLLNDASEKRNIIHQKSTIAKEMKLELKQWMNSVEDSFNGKDYEEI